MRSKLDERDLPLAGRYFLVSNRLRLTLSLYTILAYFLLSWTIPVRKNFPCGPFFVSYQESGLLRSNSLVDTLLFFLLFPRCRSLDPFSFFNDWRSRVCDFAAPFDSWIPPNDDPRLSSGKLIYQHLS